MRLKGHKKQRLAYIVLYFLFFNVSSIQCFADTSDYIFANMDYMLGSEYGSEKITLVGGEYAEPRVRYVTYTGNYVYGDFNDDGIQDAAVIFIDSGGGSADWFNLAFLIKDGDEFVHRNSVYLGDRVEISSLTEKDGKVIVDMFIRDEENWAYGMMKQVTNAYEYTGPTAWGPDYASKYNTLNSQR